MDKNSKNTVDFSKMSRDEMQNLIMELMDRNASLEAERQYYLNALKMQRARMLGRSTEQSDELQLTMDEINFFNETEAVASPAADGANNRPPTRTPGAGRHNPRSCGPVPGGR